MKVLVEKETLGLVVDVNMLSSARPKIKVVIFNLVAIVCGLC